MEQQQVNFGNCKVVEQELRIRFGDFSPKCEKKAQEFDIYHLVFIE